MGTRFRSQPCGISTPAPIAASSRMTGINLAIDIGIRSARGGVARQASPTGRAGPLEAPRLLIEAGLDRGDVDFMDGATIARFAREAAETPRRQLGPVSADPADYPDW
jgi:hypothetical protein